MSNYSFDYVADMSWKTTVQCDIYILPNNMSYDIVYLECISQNLLIQLFTGYVWVFIIRFLFTTL